MEHDEGRGAFGPDAFLPFSIKKVQHISGCNCATCLEQPIPTPGKESVTDKLIEFLRQRQQKGIQTYGRSLETFNGRNARQDALEESLDLNQYLFQMYLEERASRMEHENARQALVQEVNLLRGIASLCEQYYQDPKPSIMHNVHLRLQEWRESLKQ